ncbi:MAG: TrbG/VirB9 family P-type conjugative transfer protein [Smithella sp.]
MHSKTIRKAACLSFLAAFFVMSLTNLPFAAANDKDDLDALIQNQQQILQQLNDKKVQSMNQGLSDHIQQLEQQMTDLKKQVGSYDAQGAITSLTDQIQTLKTQIEQQTTVQNKIVEEIKDLKEKEQSSVVSLEDNTDTASTAATAKYLVNPGPSPSGFMQDGVNAQNDSQMVFTYGPNQIYKIYCKVGYLTDLQFKSGEKITFVGGGDTAKWMIDTAEANGTPHLYIKPINQSATTNLIVNTSKHIYQILATAGEWYNPMVSWSYSAEEQLANKLQQKKDEQTITDSLHITSPDQLNFNYKIKGDADWKPVMVFDDGEKTFIKFSSMTAKMPILFIKEPGKKEISLVNYRVKDNYYIVDKVFIQAELRMSDQDKITIMANK